MTMGKLYEEAQGLWHCRDSKTRCGGSPGKAIRTWAISEYYVDVRDVSSIILIAEITVASTAIPGSRHNRLSYNYLTVLFIFKVKIHENINKVNVGNFENLYYWTFWKILHIENLVICEYKTFKKIWILKIGKILNIRYLKNLDYWTFGTFSIL